MVNATQMLICISIIHLIILNDISMLLLGLISGRVTAAILFANGLHLFVLVYILSNLPAPE